MMTRMRRSGEAGSFDGMTTTRGSLILLATALLVMAAFAVYRAKNGVWVTVDRAKPCRTHAIPKKIYRGACTTS